MSYWARRVFNYCKGCITAIESRKIKSCSQTLNCDGAAVERIQKVVRQLRFSLHEVASFAKTEIVVLMCIVANELISLHAVVLFPVETAINAFAVLCFYITYRLRVNEPGGL